MWMRMGRNKFKGKVVRPARCATGQTLMQLLYHAATSQLVSDVHRDATFVQYAEHPITTS